ncbi:uncharacterized protein rp1l1b [Salminus brasiliensis]|uniref:uncharacterized protein rp1l1b n=1 Tax=Salminus brasiliensis TaxID=930266 RepID=UPI003B831D0E
MASHKRSFQCFDAIVDSCPHKPSFPVSHHFGAPQRSSHNSTRLEPVEDHVCYLCAEHQQAKLMTSEASGIQSTSWYQPQSQQNQYAHKRPSRPDGESVEDATHHHHHHHRHSKKIVLVKNSDPSVQKTIVLHRRTVRSLGVFLDDVSELMQCLIRKVYTLEGHKIDSIQSLLQCPSILVCVGREPFHPLLLDNFRKHSDNKLPKLILKSRSSACNEEQGFKNVNFGLETKKTIIHPRAYSSDKSARHAMSSEKSFPNVVPPFHAGPFSQKRESVMDDDIEKRVLVNKDGSLSMEMKVRFRLLNDETLHWSTEIKKSSSTLNESITGYNDAYHLQHANTESCSEAESISEAENTKFHQKHLEETHCQHCCTHCQEYDIWKNPILGEQGPVRHIRSSSSSASSHKIVCQKASVDSMCTMSSEEYTEHVVENATCFQQTVEGECDTTVEYCTISRCCSRSEVCSVSSKKAYTEEKCGKSENSHALDDNDNNKHESTSTIPIKNAQKDQVSVHITQVSVEENRTVSVESISSQVLASLKEDQDEEEIDGPPSHSRASLSNNQGDDEETRDAVSSPHSITPCKSPASPKQRLSPRPPSKSSGSSAKSRSRQLRSDASAKSKNSKLSELGPENPTIEDQGKIEGSSSAPSPTSNISARSKKSELSEIVIDESPDGDQTELSAKHQKSNTSTRSKTPKGSDQSLKAQEERSPSALSAKSNTSATSKKSELSDGQSEQVELQEEEVDGRTSMKTQSVMSPKSNVSSTSTKLKASALAVEQTTEFKDCNERSASAQSSGSIKSKKSQNSQVGAAQKECAKTNGSNRSQKSESARNNSAQPVPETVCEMASNDSETKSTKELKSSPTKDVRPSSKASSISRSKEKKPLSVTDRPKSNMSNASSYLEVKGQKSNSKSDLGNVQSKKPNNTRNTPTKKDEKDITSENCLSPGPSKSLNKSKKPVILLGGSDDSVLSQSVSEQLNENVKYLNTAGDVYERTNASDKTCSGPPDVIDYDRPVSDKTSEKSSKCRNRKGSSSSQQKADDEFSELVPSNLPNASPTEVVNEWLNKIPLDSALYDVGDEFHENCEELETMNRVSESTSNAGENETEGDVHVGVLEAQTEKEAQLVTEETDNSKEKDDDVKQKTHKDLADVRNNQSCPEKEDVPKSFHSSVQVMRVLLSPKLDRCNSLPEVSTVYGQKLSTSARGLLDCLVNLQLIDFDPNDVNGKAEKYKDLMNILQSLWLSDPSEKMTVTQKGKSKNQQSVDDELKAKSSSGVDVSSGSSGSGKSSVNDSTKAQKSQTNTDGEGLETLTKVQEVDETEGEEVLEVVDTISDPATPDIASRVQWTPEDEAEGAVEEILKDSNIPNSDDTIMSNDSPRDPLETPSSSNTGNDSSAKQNEAETEHQEDTSSGTPPSVQRAQLTKKPSQDPDPVWVLNLLNKLEKQFMTHYVNAMAEFKVRWNLDNNEQLDGMIRELRDEVHKRIQSSIDRELRKIQGRAGRPRPPKEALSRESTVQTEQRRRRLKVMVNQSMDPAAKSDDDYTGTGTDFSDQRSDDEYCPCDTCMKKKMASRPVLPVEVLNTAPVMMDFDLRKILQLKREAPTSNKESIIEETGNVEFTTETEDVAENVALEVLEEEEEEEDKLHIQPKEKSLEQVQNKTNSTNHKGIEKNTETEKQDNNQDTTECETARSEAEISIENKTDEQEHAGEVDTAYDETPEQGETAETENVEAAKADTIAEEEIAEGAPAHEETVEATVAEVAENKENVDDELAEGERSVEGETEGEEQPLETEPLKDVNEEDETISDTADDDNTDRDETVAELNPVEEELAKDGETTDDAITEDRGTMDEKLDDTKEDTETDNAKTVEQEDTTADGETSMADIAEDEERANESLENRDTAEDETTEDGQMLGAEIAEDREAADNGAADGLSNQEEVEIEETVGAEMSDDEEKAEAETEHGETADDHTADDQTKYVETDGADMEEDGESAEAEKGADEDRTEEDEEEANDGTAEDEEISVDGTAEDGETADGETAEDGETADGGTAEDGETADDGTAEDGETVDDGTAAEDETADYETAEDGETAGDGTAEDGETADETAENTEAADGTAEDEETADDGTAEDGQTDGDATAEDGETADDGTAEDGQTADDGTAEDGGVSVDGTAEDGETADDATGNDGGVSVDETAEDEETADEGTAEDGETADDATGEDGQTADDGTAEDGETADDGTAEDGQTANDGRAEDGGVSVDETAEDGETADEGTAEDGQTADDGIAEDGGVSVDGTAEDGETADDATGEDGGVSVDETAEDGETADDGTAEDGQTADDGTAEDGQTADDGTAEDGGVSVDGTAEDGQTADDGTAEDGETADDGTAEDGETADDGTAEDGQTADDGTADDGTVNHGETADESLEKEETAGDAEETVQRDMDESDTAEGEEEGREEAVVKGKDQTDSPLANSSIENTEGHDEVTELKADDEADDEDAPLKNEGDVVVRSIDDNASNEESKEENADDIKAEEKRNYLNEHFVNTGESAEGGDEAEDETEPDVETDDGEQEIPAVQPPVWSGREEDQSDEATMASFDAVVKTYTGSDGDGAEADVEDSETEVNNKYDDAENEDEESASKDRKQASPSPVEKNEAESHAKLSDIAEDIDEDEEHEETTAQDGTIKDTDCGEGSVKDVLTRQITKSSMESQPGSLEEVLDEETRSQKGLHHLTVKGNCMYPTITSEEDTQEKSDTESVDRHVATPKKSANKSSKMKGIK